MTGTAEVIQADALDLPLPDATVDLVVTSPPYFALRSYEDGGEYAAGQIGNESGEVAYIEALLAATAEMMRVLKPTGSIFVNLGDRYGGSTGTNTGISPKSKIHGHKGYSMDTVNAMRRATANGAIDRQSTALVPAKSLVGIPWRYAIACVDRLGLLLRAEIIWHKVNFIPDARKDRVQRNHEHIFHFVAQPEYFSALDKLRMPAPHPHSNPQGKTPASVWRIAGNEVHVNDDERRRHNLPAHLAAFPSEIPKRCILGWCPRDGVVLDPFGGSGTTAKTAREMGRHGISVDLSADYCRLAEYRIFGQTKRVNLATM